MIRKSVLPALLLTLGACSQSPAELEADAREAFARNDYAAARLLLVKALEQSPGNPALQILQARTLVALGDGERARSLLAGYRGKPAAQVAELRAEAALLAGDNKAALAALEGVETAEAERLRGMVALKANDPVLARAKLEKAVTVGGNARALIDLARLELMSGNVAGARDLAGRATRMAPASIDVLLLNGQLAVRRGDLASALATYRRAAKLYPASGPARLGEAAVLGDLGRFDAMANVLAELEARGEQGETFSYLKARLASGRKDWKMARDIVEAAGPNLAARDPRRVLLGEALLELGQTAQAVAQLTPVVRSDPGNRAAALLLARAQIAAGDPRGAVATLRPIAASPLARKEELALMARAAKASGDPKLAGYEAKVVQPEIRAVAADMADGDKAMRAGNWAGAAAAYERIRQATDGRNVVMLNNLAYAHLMLGDLGKADAAATRALALAPDNPSVLDTAGWTRFKQGRVGEARRLLRQAASKAPGNATIRAHLAEAERAKG